jgi:putative ABC transport system permease protein
MMLFKLAIKNLLGAGLRTWLNVIVLSFGFVAIIWLQGFYNGMNKQASTSMINSELGGGQYWQKNYDRYDPLTIPDSHDKIPAQLKPLIQNKMATPILVVQGTIFPDGRLMSVLLNGIDPEQKIVDIPSHVLNDADAVPALIGENMAKSAYLEKGDYVTVRWRDANGTFDATEIKIVEIMSTVVTAIDMGKIWLPIKELQRLSGMMEEATIVVVDKNFENPKSTSGWIFRDQEYLLADLTEMVKSKTIGGSIMYMLLLSLAFLAIFDTQVLSVFRRRKEIGTLVALGMTRTKVIQLFTIEGALHGVFAACVGALYGIPLLLYSAKNGWSLPGNTAQYGFALGNTLYPSYGVGLVVGSATLVLIAVTIVSYLPTRKISKLNPTDALRGKLS